VISRLGHLAIIGVILVSFFQCSEPGQEKTPPIEEKRPTQESWDSEIYITHLGERNAKIHAGHLAQYEKNSSVVLNEDVKADFYKEDEHVSTLYADSAIVFQNTNVMRAFKNVVVESDSGITLYTEQLEYTQKTEKITSDTTVTLTTETDTLHGIGFESNTELTRWKIKQPTGVTTREFKE